MLVVVTVSCCYVRVVLVWLLLCVVGVGVCCCGCCDWRCGCSLFFLYVLFVCLFGVSPAFVCVWRGLLGLWLSVGVRRPLRSVVAARCCCSLLCFAGLNLLASGVVVCCRCLTLLDG